MVESEDSGLAGAPIARTGKQILLRLARRSLRGIAAAAALVYAADYAVLRARMMFHGNATGSATVRLIYEVPQKNRSTEFLAGDVQDQTCVHSLFPHAGYSPCWYLEHYPEQHVRM